MTRRERSRSRGEEGSALVEFVYLAVLLMVPLVYVLLTVFQVQSAAFATTEAARQAGRAFARAEDVAAAQALADAAVALALRDQGIDDGASPVLRCPDGPCLAPGTRVEVTVRYQVRLRFLGALFSESQGPSIPVTAVHTQVVDAFQAAP